MPLGLHILGLVLISLVILLFSTMTVYFGYGSDFNQPTGAHWLVAILLPMAMSVYGIRKKSLDKSGAIAGWFVGFLHSISNYSFMASLLACFIFASKATKFKSSKKKKFEEDFKEGGQRNWIQVMCNIGPSSLMTVLYILEVGFIDLPINFTKSYSASWYALAVMACIACACGDTFASEIGSVAGTTDPFHIITLKRVPRGTNGGVSAVGTLSSLFGGFLTGFFCYLTVVTTSQSILLHKSPHQWPIIIYGTFAGFLGSLIDSLLGSTLQFSGKHKKLQVIVERNGPDIEHISGREILNNHSVNFLSCLMTGIIMPCIAAQTWHWFW